MQSGRPEGRMDGPSIGWGAPFNKKGGELVTPNLGCHLWDSWQTGAQLCILGGSTQFGTTAKEAEWMIIARNVCFGRCIVFCLAPGPFVDIPCWECEIIIQILIYGWGIWGNLSPLQQNGKIFRAQSNCKPISHQGNSAKGNRKVSYIELSNCKKGFLSKNLLRFVQPDLILTVGFFSWELIFSAPKVGTSLRGYVSSLEGSTFLKGEMARWATSLRK